MDTLRRLGKSVVAVLGLSLLAAGAVALAAWNAPAAVVGVVLLVLVAGLGWVGQFRPGPALGALALVGVLAALAASLAHDRATVWLGLLVAVAVVAGLVDDPLRQRLAPGVRAVGLPGVRSDPRPEVPGPFALLVLATVGVLAIMLVLGDLFVLPDWVGAVVLMALLGALVLASMGLRTAVMGRRQGTSDAAATRALENYAPQFYVYFSGEPEGEYQLRMWLPYLERLDLPFAILSRQPRLLPRAEALTSKPVVLCERLAAMDSVMVSSVRAVFYVNTHHQCVDGVRYLDRTHVHLNHGDSDKPSSFHPMIGMFDQVFVAGQAAVDRFSRHGVVVPTEKFVLVGRPQVSDIVPDNVAPLPGHTTVLYAPTWRGGVRDMTFSSLDHGAQIVQALIDRGVRVIFRPHPFSLREKGSARDVARIDALLAGATDPDLPHLTSSQTATEPITESFNRSDALVTDVSSVASDYLQSAKPMAVADLGSTGGQVADAEAFPVLSGAYVLDLGADASSSLDAQLATMVGADPLADVRADLRTYYLGDQPDSATTFVDRAGQAVRNMP